MKKLVLLLSVVLISISQSFAQDRLFFLSGDETDVKITEVTSSEVKYKRMDNLEGPTFSTLKSELFMIKYANGQKEMIAAAEKETTQPTSTDAATTEEEYQTNNSEEASSNSSSGLSSSVMVTNEPTANSYSATDKWGRTEAENRRLQKKKIKQGAVLMGVGGLTVGVGGTLLYLGSVNNSTSTVGPEDGVNRDVPTVALGVVGIIGGSAMLVSGAILLGVSSKYKKRADQLANGSATISPTTFGIQSFNGVQVNTSSGYGIRLCYNF